MRIQSSIKRSRGRSPFPYAISATERNLSEKASSITPRVTFTRSIHPPDLGIDCSQPGNIANRVKGMAIASEKPNIPTVGARMLPVEAASTSRNPMMGPVHENDTIVSVSAMKNMPPRPAADEDLRSVPVLQREGRVISNTPKKESAKATRIRKNSMFTKAFVASALSALAPNIRVMTSASATYTAMMESP